MKCIVLLFALVLFGNATLPFARAAEERFTINVRKSGAVGDGVVLDTDAIQRCIDTCNERGGGIVLFPEGKYLTGSLSFKGNVTLRLDSKASLLGSKNIADYHAIESFIDAVGIPRGYCLLGAVDAKNIGIERAGIIDGQSKDLLAARAEADKDKRSFLIRFVRCTGVSLKDVHLQSSSAWTVHLFQCNEVAADHVTICSHGLQYNSCQRHSWLSGRESQAGEHQAGASGWRHC